MQLRPTQEIDVNKVAQKLASGVRKIVLQEPTGTGKTVIFSAISDRYTSKSDKDVLILVHRKKLLAQTRNALFNGFGITSQVIVAGMRYIPPARVYVGMIESVYRRLNLIKNIGLVIIDEAHYQNFNKIHEHFQDQFIIGFTATPLTANKEKPMKKYYEDIVCGPQISELIKLGYLCQNVTYAPEDVVNRSSLTVKNGEFDEQAMALQFSKPKYVNNTVTKYQKYFDKTKAIVFNVNIDHCREVHNAFTAAGYKSKIIDSTLEPSEQEAVYKWFEETPGAILNSVNIPTAGFDEPTIECVIFNRATLSMPLWIQCTGRGSRPNPAKSAFGILDMGNNIRTHGDWSDYRDWADIFHNPPKAKTKEGVAPVKTCPSCEAMIPAQARTCPYCGYIYPSKESELETELQDFVIVTRGIDVQKVIADNAQRKEYYPFFKIGKDLAVEAKKTIPKLTDEIVEFILTNYFTLAEQWCKAKNKKFNAWHKERAREVLYKELSDRFKNWQPLKQTA